MSKGAVPPHTPLVPCIAKLIPCSKITTCINTIPILLAVIPCRYYYMTQLPSAFGFVSPMITYFALDVRNWWIVFDIIVGAALIFVYMLLCAFHRVLLAPSKH